MQAKSASAEGDDKNAKIRMWLSWGLLVLAVIAFLAALGVIIGVRVSQANSSSGSGSSQ